MRHHDWAGIQNIYLCHIQLAYRRYQYYLLSQREYQKAVHLVFCDLILGRIREHLLYQQMPMPRRVFRAYLCFPNILKEHR